MGIINEDEVNKFIESGTKEKLMKVLVAAGTFIITVIGYVLLRKPEEEPDSDATE